MSGPARVTPVYYENLIIVLMYHFVAEQEREPSTRIISAARLQSHLDALVAAGYTIIPMDAYLAFVRGHGTLPRNAVLLTFDDGDISFANLAYPLLRRFGVTASNFIKVQLADDQDPRHLSWADMRSMQAAGMSFYSHTYGLHRLAAADAQGQLKPALAHRLYLPEKGRAETADEYRARIQADLSLAQARIDAELGPQAKLLCYPYGAYNDTVIEVGKAIGIERFFTIEEGINDRLREQVLRLNAGSTALTAEGLLAKIRRFHP